MRNLQVKETGSQQVAKSAAKPKRPPPIREKAAAFENIFRAALFEGAAAQVLSDSTNGTAINLPSRVEQKVSLLCRLPSLAMLNEIQSRIERMDVPDKRRVASVVAAVLRGRAAFRAEHRDYADALIVELTAAARHRRWSIEAIALGIRSSSNACKFLPEVVEVIDACAAAHSMLMEAYRRAQKLEEARSQLEDDLIVAGWGEEPTDE